MNYQVTLDQLIKVHQHETVSKSIGVTVTTLRALASGQRGINIDKLYDLAEAFPEFCITKTVLSLAFKRKMNGQYKGIN